MAYAKGTTTDTTKSRAEIEQLLRRAGAEKFMSGFDENAAMIGFQMRGRQIKFALRFPSMKERRVTHFKDRYGHEKPRTESAAAKFHEDECRRLWRCLLLSIKAKLAAIEDGISSFDVEFMPFIVVAPGGVTLADHIIPQLNESSSAGRLPALPWSANA